jgi:CheY-like chemotaxis protein
MSGSDALKLASDGTGNEEINSLEPWHLLVVDDDSEVHNVTRLALGGFQFAGRPLAIHSAYSGREAQQFMAENINVAAILLDVVMENDTAGLDCVRYIRRELKNSFVRIVLRTGQPGQAPEYDVITQYDINDYKEKTELTRQKLFTCVYTSLSCYRDLVALEKNRRGLLRVIEASADLFRISSLDQFAQGVIEQLSALMYMDQDFLVFRTSGVALEQGCGDFHIVASTGKFEGMSSGSELFGLHPEVRQRIDESLSRGENRYGQDYVVALYNKSVLYIAGDKPLEVPDVSLVELFAKNVAIAYEKLVLIAADQRS